MGGDANTFGIGLTIVLIGVGGAVLGTIAALFGGFWKDYRWDGDEPEALPTGAAPDSDGSARTIADSGEAPPSESLG